MASEAGRHARIFAAIWRDKDFRMLGADAKLLYLALCTAEKLTYCGSLDSTPKQLAAVIANENGDYTPARTRKALGVLVPAEFVVLDELTDEMAVRSFMRHDQVLKSPNVTKAAMKALRAVVSDRVRDCLDEELRRIRREVPDAKGWVIVASDFPEIFTRITGNPSRKGSPKGSGKGSPKDSGNSSPNSSPDPSSDPSLNSSPNGSGNLAHEGAHASASPAFSPCPMPLAPGPVPTTSGAKAAPNKGLVLVEDGDPAGANAGRIIGEWIRLRGPDNRPAKQLIGQASTQLKQLLEVDKYPFEAVRAGFFDWADRNINPSAITSCVDTLRQGGRKADRKPSTTDQRVAEGLALRDHYAQLDAAEGLR